MRICGWTGLLKKGNPTPEVHLSHGNQYFYTQSAIGYPRIFIDHSTFDGWCVRDNVSTTFTSHTFSWSPFSFKSAWEPRPSFHIVTSTTKNNQRFIHYTCGDWVLLWILTFWPYIDVSSVSTWPGDMRGSHCPTAAPQTPVYNPISHTAQTCPAGSESCRRARSPPCTGRQTLEASARTTTAKLHTNC